MNRYLNPNLFWLWLPLAMMVMQPKAICAASKQKAEEFKAEALVIPAAIQIPPRNSDRATPVLVAIKLTNVSSKSILVTKYNPGEVELISPDKKVLKPSFGRDYSLLPERNEFLWLGPSRSTYILTDCHLSWFNGALHLGGDDPSGGVWSIKNIKAGKYRLVLRYKPTPVKFGKPHWKDERGLPRTEPWYGEVAADPVPIEIKGEKTQ